MVYVLVDSKEGGEVLLVKAMIEEDVMDRLHLCDTQKIVGRLTDNEMSVLQTSKFAVITA